MLGNVGFRKKCLNVSDARMRFSLKINDEEMRAGTDLYIGSLALSLYQRMRTGLSLVWE